MNQQVELVSKNKIQVITLKFAKEYLRVDHNYDDQLIEQMMDTAYDMAVNYMGIQLHESKWKMTIYGNFPSWVKLIYAPISKIEHVKLFKHNGEIGYLSNDKYYLDLKHEVLHIKNFYSVQKAEIQYFTGFNTEKFPAAIKQGILEHLSKLYDFRGGDQAIPLAAKNLYQSYKRIKF